VGGRQTWVAMEATISGYRLLNAIEAPGLVPHMSKNSWRSHSIPATNAPVTSSGEIEEEKTIMEDKKAHNLEPRVNLSDPAVSGVMRAMYGLEEPLRKSRLEPALRELVKVRASQINGCAYCIDMHTKDARAQGETEQRLYALNAWRETPFYTDRERAALEWTEQLTLIAGRDVPDELYAWMREHFSEEEMISLTLAVVQINAWNRLAIPFRAPVGSYQPAQHHTAATASR
jgi:AhpD family alkylhydroperoxidase